LVQFVPLWAAPVYRLIACAARPCGVSTTMSEAGLVPYEDLSGAEGVTRGYLAASAADMPIVAIFLSGHVSCVLLRQTFGTTTTWANRCAADRRATVSKCGLETRQPLTWAPSWHRLGPLHMPLESKGCGHGAVAIPIVAIRGLVAVNLGEQRAQPQQPDVTHHETLIGWRGG
jgi:hypothetical protein